MVMWLCLQCRRPGFDPWVGKIPWKRSWQSTPLFLPGDSHGQRSLLGYSPWGLMELDTTEGLTVTGGLVTKCLPSKQENMGSIPRSGKSPREVNGDTRQYVYLGNPLDRGAWRATVHGVAKESDMT